MKYPASPDAKSAIRLLRDVSDQPACCAPRLVDKPLALYGAGNLGRMAKEYFDRLGIRILFAVDSNPRLHRQDPFWRGIAILAPHEVNEKQRATVLLAVCVATASFSEISILLAAQAWTDVIPFYDIAEAYRDRHPLGNGWFAGMLDEEDRQPIEHVLSLWADDISRAHHLQFIAWHRLREDWLFEDAPVTTGDRYFVPPILSCLHDHETFIDAGAHHGEASIRFAQITQYHFREICAIEPDANSILKLRRQLKSIKRAHDELGVRVLSCAVGDEAGERKFYGGLGYASQLCEFGERVVKVETIDRLGLAPSFVKLHLEGGELNALKGALETIRRHRPLIAATTYHNRLGLSQLPEWVMCNLTDYFFLMRLHSWCGTGSVIYCIPKERYSVGEKSMCSICDETTIR